MPLLGNKPKQKEATKNNGDDVSPEQWIKNSGHSLKGIFLEWLSEQKLFAIIDGEIKRIKKENQRKKNMTPEDKLAWKRKAAKLSDETIAKFGKEYLGQNSAEETKEYIRNGLNTVANQIKTGNFYKKASLFGDEDMDKFMEDLEAEWDEDEFSSSGESFMKPHREFMLANEPITKNDKHQQNYELEKNSYDGTYNYTVNIDTQFPGHFNVTVKNKDSERPSGVVKSILENMDKIEALWKEYISSPKFKKEFESEWEDIQYTIDTEGDEWLENVESEMDRSGFVKDPLKLKADLWKYATNPENIWLYFDEGSDKITVVFGYYLEWVQQGFDWEVKLKDMGIATTKGESYFMKYKAMGEFSKGGSDKNVFTIGLGDIKRYEGLLKIYTSTKKSIRGFISKVIKIANKDVNEAKEYANKNNIDSLLDKMSDADNNLLDEMSDLVKGKLEPKNLPANVAKKMKSYLDKQHKVFTSYDIPEDLYNKWKEIYSSNESDPTMKAINNTARFFEPNIVNGSDYSKIFDKFKDFKVSAPTPAAEMIYLTQRESVLSNDDIEELSNAIDRYNAMKREYGPKLLKVMNTVMNNKEDLDQGEITINDFDVEEFSASDASYDLEKAIKNIDAINFDKSDYTTKERLRQEFKHLMDVCDFEVIPRSDSEKWKKFSEDNYSSRFSSQYPDIVEFIDRELSYLEKDFLASKEFKNIYKRVGEAKLNDIINKSPIGENFIKRLGGKR